MQDIKKSHALSRPDLSRLPDVALPFYPRSMGHFYRYGGYSETVPENIKDFVQLFWCIAGAGEFLVDGKWLELKADEVFYRLPGQAHIDRTRTEPWEYRWIAFDGAGAADVMRSYNYPDTPFYGGVCPHSLFMEFEERLRECTPYAWRRMVAIISAILAEAGGVPEDPEYNGGIFSKALQICKEQFKDQGLNVNILAEKLEVSRTTLLRVFRSAMYTTPSEYLQSLRLQHATSLLEYRPDVPVHKVAERSGFSDPGYFSRLIRKRFGKSPIELRTGTAWRQPRHK